MKILIADDQEDVRNALRVLLEHVERSFVIDEAEDIENLYAQLNKIRPDLLLMDWELSNHDMAGEIPQIREAAPGVRIIALSVRPEAQSDAIDAGADAFASKGDNPDSLISIIHSLI